jgi:alanyl-tRNA synthetase
MIHTNRLYFDDPTGSPFDAVVVAHALSGDRPSLILDRSGFYPESGGQMADRGLLGGLEVVDVQVDDARSGASRPVGLGPAGRRGDGPR